MIQWLLVTIAELALCEPQHGRRQTKRNPKTYDNNLPVWMQKDAFVVVVEAVFLRSTEDWHLLRAGGSVFTEVSFHVGGRYTCIRSSRWIVLRDERG